jgi:hypothetical protein
MGRIPGTMLIPMPAAEQRSRYRKYTSVSKKNCVMARFAPASILRFKFSTSASTLPDSGCPSG